MNKLKEFWDKNKKYVKPTVHALREGVNSAVKMRDNPNILDYVNLGFEVKNIYNKHFAKNDLNNYVYNKEWRSTKQTSFVGGLVANAIDSQQLPKILLGTAGHKDNEINTPSNFYCVYETVIQEVRFRWAVYRKWAAIVFVENNVSCEIVNKILTELVWKQYSTKHIALGTKHADSGLPEDSYYMEEDGKSNFFTPTPLCQTYINDLNQYKKRQVSHSILFQGPQGSGKSNLIKNICFGLDLRSLRIKDLDKMSYWAIEQVINLFKPEIIILEDVDHMLIRDEAGFLDKLEEFNEGNRIILATANNLKKLDGASYRPKRFDEIKKIHMLDKEVVMDLVHGDQEIFDKVSDWPAAFISELMKRVSVLGRERALSGMEDLTERVRQL